MLSLSAVTENGFNVEGVKPAPLHDPKVLENILEPGDIVVSRSNTPERVGFAGQYVGEPAPCAYPDLLMRVRPTPSLEPEFLLAHLLSQRGRRFFAESARGSSSSMVKIDRAILESFPVPLPTIPEQRAIAAALSDVDALLGALDRLIAKKRDLKQAAMQQLLTGQTRLPGFGDDWESASLGELGVVTMGRQAAPQHRLGRSPRPYLRVVNVSDDRLDLRDVKEMDFSGADFEKYRLAPGDVLLTEGDLVSAHNIGRSAVFRGEIAECCFQNTLLRFRPGPSIIPEYAQLAFGCLRSQGKFAVLANGTTVFHLGSEKLKALRVPLPTLPEQQAIATVFGDIEGELSAIAQRRDTSAQAGNDAGAAQRKDAPRMSAIGEAEKRTQRRVVRLFVDELGYDYLGNLSEGDNRNIIEGQLEHFLWAYQGFAEREDGDTIMRRAIAEVVKVASNTSLSLYDRNRAVYDLLRYGVKVKADVGAQTETVWLLDWKTPEKNRFAIAEEVTVKPADPKAHGKRPDIVLYVNGIALGVLELKRSTVSVAEGIRQNLDNQKKEFIQPFFSTMQYVMAGNDTEGLRYGTIQTREKYYLAWKEDSSVGSPLDSALRQLCGKARFLELVHDFVVFDAGIKKLCRHNQYFGVRAAEEHVRRREGGILWHTQGSGKSLTMVWLAKWIRENVKDSRVLIITDRTELDEQIEKVFKGVDEDIHRTKSGADLIAALNAVTPWLLCSLIHKFGGKEDGENVGDIKSFVEELKTSLPKDFRAKGDLFVFVDECHRTQSGDLHEAMKSILPDAVFIGFTGTPLLKADKKKSIEIFGRYIHTYKFGEAVKDGVVLDLRYEARDIDQNITSQKKIDQWFEAKTKGLTPLAKAQLKARWGTMQKVLSSQSRLQKIVADILLDMETRDRLKSGRGSAILVAGSIYEACKFYELFAKSPLGGKCAIVTSYAPRAADIKGEESGEGATDALEKYAIYRQMLADWFNEPPEQAVTKVEAFEKAVKKKFIDEPGQMKLLIVVDKLLTGFDAPPATYLYIDKQMRDHGLFQAICRVNRLDGDDKEFGYIVDYKDLFPRLEGAVDDYTSGALDGYDKEDVAGLLEDRVGKARERLEEALEAVRALCEPVEPPRDDQAFYRYFSSSEHGDAAQLKANEPQRLALYKLTSALVRAYANLANEMSEAGYREAEAEAIKKEVSFYENLRSQVKLHSGDAIDLKQYEPAMRHLIDTYIRAEESEKVSEFDDLSLVQLIVQRGADAVKALPEAIRKKEKTTAETIENNVRKLIIDESPINPKYYERMSELLDALIEQRKQAALSYQEYLAKIVELTKQAKGGPNAGAYPASLNTGAKRALYDNLNRDEGLALEVDQAVRTSMQDGWRINIMKTKRVRKAIGAVLGEDDPRVDQTLELVKSQNDY